MNKLVCIRVDADEYRRWQRLSRALALPLSTWIRTTCRQQAAADADRIPALERRTAALEGK